MIGFTTLGKEHDRNSLYFCFCFNCHFVDMVKDMSEYSPHPAIEYIWDNAPAYAKAKGELAQLEAFKSSLKAILMKESGETSIGGQEREAYAHPKYQTHCDAIGAATEQAELLKWRMTSAQMRFDAWRTEQASNRQIEKIIK